MAGAQKAAMANIDMPDDDEDEDELVSVLSVVFDDVVFDGLVILNAVVTLVGAVALIAKNRGGFESIILSYDYT